MHLNTIRAKTRSTSKRLKHVNWKDFWTVVTISAKLGSYFGRSIVYYSILLLKRDLWHIVSSRWSVEWAFVLNTLTTVVYGKPDWLQDVMMCLAPVIDSCDISHCAVAAAAHDEDATCVPYRWSTETVYWRDCKLAVVDALSTLMNK